MRLVERVRRGVRVDLPALLEAEVLRIHLHRRGQHGHREHRKDRELVHFSFRIFVGSVPRRRQPWEGGWMGGVKSRMNTASVAVHCRSRVARSRSNFDKFVKIF